MSTSTVERRLCESDPLSWIATITKEEQEDEERSLGQETQGMDTRTVEICTFVDVSKFEIFGSTRHFFVRCRKWWADGFYMCGSHHAAWRRRCDVVEVLCWWHRWWFIQNSRQTEPAWLTCHPIWFALSGTIIFFFLTGQWPLTRDAPIHFFPIQSRYDTWADRIGRYPIPIQYRCWINKLYTFHHVKGTKGTRLSQLRQNNQTVTEHCKHA